MIFLRPAEAECGSKWLRLDVPLARPASTSALHVSGTPSTSAVGRGGQAVDRSKCRTAWPKPTPLQ